VVGRHGIAESETQKHESYVRAEVKETHMDKRGMVTGECMLDYESATRARR
jgi:hypothetical protein